MQFNLTGFNQPSHIIFLGSSSVFLEPETQGSGQKIIYGQKDVRLVFQPEIKGNKEVSNAQEIEVKITGDILGGKEIGLIGHKISTSLDSSAAGNKIIAQSGDTITINLDSDYSTERLNSLSHGVETIIKSDILGFKSVEDEAETETFINTTIDADKVISLDKKVKMSVVLESEGEVIVLLFRTVNLYANKPQDIRLKAQKAQDIYLVAEG